MIRTLIPLADGCEEVEAVGLIDVLRRAGWDVVTAGLKPGPVHTARNIQILPDTEFGKVDLAGFQLLVLPGGGGGMEALRADERILKTIRDFVAGGKFVGAICASPLVLHRAGVLAGRRITSYPSVKEALPGVIYSEDPVVRDGQIFTSRGPGTTLAFALALVEALDSKEKAFDLRQAMLA